MKKKEILSKLLKEVRALPDGEYRRRTGLRRTNLARTLGKDCNPTIDTLTRVAKAVGMTVRVEWLEKP